MSGIYFYLFIFIILFIFKLLLAMHGLSLVVGVRVLSGCMVSGLLIAVANLFAEHGL